MKSLSKLALCLLLAMSLTVSAFAAQVPDSLVGRHGQSAMANGGSSTISSLL